MVITAGKPSFQFQTNELAQQFDDNGVRGVWSQKALTLLCPMAMSPQLLNTKESAGGLMTESVTQADPAGDALMESMTTLAIVSQDSRRRWSLVRRC